MGSVNITMRAIATADLARIVELNDAASPAVPITSPAAMVDLLALADFTIAVVDDADAPLAFVIAFGPSGEYASENYRYFQNRGTDFLYVDRIVIAEQHRGAGIGRQLYAVVFDQARAEGRVEVTCEVNTEPPNPESLAFHARLGFTQVGEQATKNDTVRVALLAASV
jgi:predicted GNAT superfamily acetyltransferase